MLWLLSSVFIATDRIVVVLAVPVSAEAAFVDRRFVVAAAVLEAVNDVVVLLTM